MSEGNSETDLFGAPLQMPRERRGRPEHERTRQTSNKALLLFARGATPKQVATALGITVPTLRKHYFSELERRDGAALMMEGEQLARLNAAAERGNVTAERALMKALEKGRLRQLADQVAERGPASAKANSPKLGKKEEQKLAAQGVDGIFAPPPAPTLLN